VSDTLSIDYQLVAEVSHRATGARIHSLANILTIYQGAAFAFDRTKDPVWINRFTSAEEQLRQFVFRSRMESLRRPLPWGG
jgi:hypothetical protein